MFDGIGQRRAAAWRQRFDLRLVSLRIEEPDRHDGLDIGAVVGAAVAVNDEAKIGRWVPVVDEVAHHVARDLDLRDAFDLAPHRVGGVEDDDYVVGCLSRDREQKEGCEGSQEGTRNEPHRCQLGRKGTQAPSLTIPRVAVQLDLSRSLDAASAHARR